MCNLIDAQDTHSSWLVRWPILFSLIVGQAPLTIFPPAAGVLDQSLWFREQIPTCIWFCEVQDVYTLFCYQLPKSVQLNLHFLVLQKATNVLKNHIQSHAFFIEFPHSSKSLWYVTPSSEGGTEILVGGPIGCVLCQLGWASPPNQLCRVVMSVGQIHFCGLQLGIELLKNSELRVEQLSAPLIGWNKT